MFFNCFSEKLLHCFDPSLKFSLLKSEGIMAKIKEKKPEQEVHFRFPLTRTNFSIIFLGMVVLVTGYILMYIPDNPDAFMTRTLAPILLVFGYLIIIPIGLFYREKKVEKQ